MPLWSDCAGFLATRCSAEISKDHPSVPACTNRCLRLLLKYDNCNLQNKQGHILCPTPTILLGHALVVPACTDVLSASLQQRLRSCKQAQEHKNDVLVPKSICANQCRIWPMNEGCLPAVTHKVGSVLQDPRSEWFGVSQM